MNAPCQFNHQRINRVLTLVYAHTFVPLATSLPYCGVIMSGGALWN